MSKPINRIIARYLKIIVNVSVGSSILLTYHNKYIEGFQFHFHTLKRETRDTQAEAVRSQSIDSVL